MRVLCTASGWPCQRLLASEFFDFDQFYRVRWYIYAVLCAHIHLGVCTEFCHDLVNWLVGLQQKILKRIVVIVVAQQEYEQNKRAQTV